MTFRVRTLARHEMLLEGQNLTLFFSFARVDNTMDRFHLNQNNTKLKITKKMQQY